MVRARISWSPDGRRLLACTDGRAWLLTEHGAVVRELAQREVSVWDSTARLTRTTGKLANYLDARWMSDGRIAAIDEYGTATCLTMQGQFYTESRTNLSRVTHAAISKGAEEFVVIDSSRITVRTIDGSLRWSATRDAYDGHPIEIASAALAAGGSRIAIGFDTPAVPLANRPPGRGWMVLDEVRKTAWPPPAPEQVDDRWFPVDDTLAAIALELDDRGHRLGIASGCATGSGAIWIGGAGEPDTVGAATAVAFDPLAARVAYVLPRAERALRVDYLSTVGAGARAIEIMDSHAIDPGIGVIAIAFDLEGHRIACLGDGGAIEIVPVP